MQIAERVFVVSGGASGLGAACAAMLVEAGARVLLIDLNAQALAARAAELGERALTASR